MSRQKLTALALGGAMFCAPQAFAQGFNIDLGYLGTPSSSFGAAAGQAEPGPAHPWHRSHAQPWERLSTVASDMSSSSL